METYRCNECGEEFPDVMAVDMACPFCGSDDIIEAEEFARLMEEVGHSLSDMEALGPEYGG